ncbi:MAG: ATP-binding protein [Labilithrix sp.]|nr:ATP-binding protein [Labilithrix sp.]MCW5818035.1 ATP-binding protein [Labilithrix sp.]
MVRRVTLLTWVAAASLLAFPVRAQDAGAETNVCKPIERQLEAARRAATDARSEKESAEHEAAECKEELESTSARLQQSVDATKVCAKERAHTCSATSAFVDELTRGKSRGGVETGCIPSELQTRLDGVVAGWTGTTTWIGQLAAYQSGESDTFPRPRPGGERSLLRLAANGQRTFQRRLLVHALELIAPIEWRRIRGGGATAIDAWFAAAEPLDATIVAEAQQPPAAPSGLAGPPLTAALHLVGAFQVAAECNLVPLEGECRRARQLQQLLESTGPLVVRRRVQEIWATECGSISADTVGAWIEDFPTAHVSAGSNPWTEIAEDAHAKLFACYLDDATAEAPYDGWLSAKLPIATQLTAAKLQRVDAIVKQWDDASRASSCARAVRVMQTMDMPSRCELPSANFKSAVEAWVASGAKQDDSSASLVVCAQFARLLWEGKAASIDGSFTHPPSIGEMVATDPDVPPTAMARLRTHCEERRGAPATFANDLGVLATLARGFGEGPDRPPFRVDAASGKPVELVRFEAAQGTGKWLQHVARGVTACTLVGLEKDRCNVCASAGPGSTYDCALVARLEESWAERSSRALGAAGVLLLAFASATWLRRIRRARATYGAWARDTTTFFEGIGLRCRPDPWRVLLPSRYDTLHVTLPSDPAWERWGTAAALVRVPPGRRVLERDVNHGAFVARRFGASVVLLEHDDEASSDLSAIRAMLEWAAKGGSRAVQILPIGGARVRWSKSAHDVLDLVEESSLRGNPFDLRGRIATSTHFFNRERLVSGLLAAAQAGHWVVVTGLRRFGKSSLTLEVARRLTGPSAYVDVAGFDHEIGHRTDPGAAVDAILRFVCMRLVESARARWTAAVMPEPPGEGASLDAAALTKWFRELARACQKAAGRTPPILVILDEIEQALAVGPEKLAHALDVLAIVLGRLKSAVGDSAALDGGAPIGVFLSSALHPLLWAPLRTLAHQSIMGSFQRVCVPCLGSDAATTMMRSLGARQGIRFTDAALARMVEESQGVPLLLRRLGSSVLELYDAERARQGSLGAVEVGVEGTTEAVLREEREGSPLRVWVESEIAPRNAVPGALLHHLAQSESVSVDRLSTLATKMVADDFVQTGIDKTLAPYELARRAEEAAHVIVQLLHESGLLVPHGDLTAPDGYSLPEGAIRRVLRQQDAVSESPSARPAP